MRSWSGAFSRVLVFLALLIFTAGPVGAAEGLSLWVHPYLPATELIKRFSPFADYLAKKIAQPISVQVESNYQAHLDRVGCGKADIAYIGPTSFMKMVEKYGPKPMLARLEISGSPVFYGMIVVRRDSAVQSLAELKGKSFAFGDPNSTMSHILPSYMLQQAGVMGSDLAEHAFLGSHRNVALGVLGGYYDAGGVKEEIFYEYKDRGLRLLAQSPPVSEHLFVTRSDLPEETVKRLRQAMLGIKRANVGPEILKPIKKTATGLVSVELADYDILREISRLSKGGGEQ